MISASQTAAANTFSFERVAAVLQPFDMQSPQYGSSPNSGVPGMGYLGNVAGDMASKTAQSFGGQFAGGMASRMVGKSGGEQGSGSSGGGPLSPILETGGLLFPFNPTIAEGVNVSYEPVKLVHSNESYYVYQSTDNQQINLSDCVWVADTFSNARYVLSVIHFFRSYSLMDFGRGRTGRPPSPMWFTAYGHYGFDRIPVLMQKADWSWPSNEEMDYVGIPEPGTAEWESCSLASSPAGSGRMGASNLGDFGSDSSSGGGGPYTWIPIKFKVNAINLIVQHSPQYWLSFNLDDYRSGDMLKQRGGFHIALPPVSGPIQTVAANKLTLPTGTKPPPTNGPKIDLTPATDITDPTVTQGVLSGLGTTAGGG